MEIIGLVVIVILITLGMLFMAMFAFKESPQKRIITQKGLAVSTISTVMKTTITDPECVSGSGRVFLQLGGTILEDCAINHDSLYFSQYQCGGMSSCDFFRAQTWHLLNDTLGTWNKRYQFSSFLIDPALPEPVSLYEPIVNPPGSRGCPPTRDRESSDTFPLSTDVGIVESVLYLCD